MPALKRDGHERFAQGKAMGRTGPEAYMAAGYDPRDGGRRGAWRLMRRGDVRTRIAELLAAGLGLASRLGITQRLAQIADLAQALNNAAGLSVARAAVVDIAKLHGLSGPEQPPQEGSTRTMVLADHPLSEDEWRRLHLPTE